MNIKPSLIDNTTPYFPSESNTDNIYTFNSTLDMNEVDTPKKYDLLNEQFRLERDITNQSSIKTQDSFKTTYSSLQTILSQMQVKLASVFLQETEYLKQHEQQLEQDEQLLTKRIQQLKTIQIEREQLEKEFSKLKNQIETAVIDVIKFQTDGEQILRILFSESRQIDEELSGLISSSLASLSRSRIIVNSNINEFSQKSEHIQLELTDREILIRNSQLSIILMLELVNTLNQVNIEHSHDITMAITDFEKQYQQFNNLKETTKNQLNIPKEMDEIRLLENEKCLLQKELLEETVLLENISTILGKAIY